MSVPSRQRKDMTDPEAEKENIKMKKSNAILKDENLQRKRGTSAGEKIEKKKRRTDQENLLFISVRRIFL